MMYILIYGARIAKHANIPYIAPLAPITP